MLIAGTSDFPSGEEVLHDLNDGLGYRHFGRLRRRVQIFDRSENTRPQPETSLLASCDRTCNFFMRLSNESEVSILNSHGHNRPI